MNKSNLSEDFIIKNNWVKTGYVNKNITYEHKNWNILNDDFYIQMVVYDDNLVIITEETKFGYNIPLFNGALKTNDDLICIMNLLDYDF